MRVYTSRGRVLLVDPKERKCEMYETRELWAQGLLRVVATVEPDMDTSPGDYECYSDMDERLWRTGAWEYVGIVARVEWDSVVIGEGCMWGVEHGQLDAVTTDAWEWVLPSEKRTASGERQLVGGSPLAEAVAEALDVASRWVGGLARSGGCASRLSDAQAWAGGVA